jgi:membrane protease YdiL (CAAX protease family)
LTAWPEDEPRRALKLAAWVLLVLTLVKPLGGIAYLGTAAFTAAALLQLYLPFRRIDALGLRHAHLGLSWEGWRRELAVVALLCAVTFPPYIALYHWFMTAAHTWLAPHPLAQWVPKLAFAPRLPPDAWAWLKGAMWFTEATLTHFVGVALPEETFYRGYLQPQLARRFSSGTAVLLATALFALGHFLGEWNPLRLGPFLPGLVFAWQRNLRGSLVGCITFHALCNLLGEVLFTLYR